MSKELLEELEQELDALLRIQIKARKYAHNLAKSFVDHPKGCVYCLPPKPEEDKQ